MGPAGTGKSYLLKGLIELARSKGLVVTKVAPSGVAAHLIGGTTLHKFLSLDIECQSTLENDTVEVTKLRKTDVIVIDEFSMLDYYLFHVTESLPNMVHLGYPGVVGILLCLGILPNYLLWVDVMFGTHLWRTFSVLVLREIKKVPGSRTY